MTLLAQSLCIQSNNSSDIEYQLPYNLLKHGDWQLGFNSVVLKTKKKLETCVPLKFECNLVGHNVQEGNYIVSTSSPIFQCVVERQEKNNCQFIQNANLVWLKITHCHEKLIIIVRNALTNELLGPDSFSISIIINIQRYK